MKGVCELASGPELASYPGSPPASHPPKDQLRWFSWPLFATGFFFLNNYRGPNNKLSSKLRQEIYSVAPKVNQFQNGCFSQQELIKRKNGVYIYISNDVQLYDHVSHLNGQNGHSENILPKDVWLTCSTPILFT